MAVSVLASLRRSGFYAPRAAGKPLHRAAPGTQIFVRTGAWRRFAATRPQHEIVADGMLRAGRKTGQWR